MPLTENAVQINDSSRFSGNLRRGSQGRVISLQRLIRLTEQGQVLYRAEKRDYRRSPHPGSLSLLLGVARAVTRCKYT
jgi:hypothetical protein